MPRPLDDDATTELPAIAITIPVRLIGLIVLALIGVTMVALASWSVDDPSLSYATSKHAQNWLGFPGAVIADLAFQVFGLGIVLILIPPALWGWSLVRRRVPRRLGLRLVAWVAASLLATGVLGFLAIPASWPLPTGLGGLIGAGFLNLATLVSGAHPPPVTATLFAIIITAPALALYWLALGARSPMLPATAPKGRGKAAVDPDAPEHSGLLDVLIGGAVHLGFSARTAFRRSMESARANADARREAEAQDWREGAVEPGMAGAEPVAVGRREPRLVIEPRAYGSAPEEPVEDDYAPETEDYAEEEAEEAEPSRARVAAPAKRPAPGSRATREAQRSLLEDESGFELPELGLLAEPKHKGMSEEHRPERLEAMARRLEGVLEDFGVKGDIINVRPGPVVTLYELEPAPGIKSSRVISLADDIARSMSAISARVAVVPGRNAIGIELPNENRETVYLREMLASTDFEKMKGKLPICLGKTIGGEPIIADLARMPHLLIAGTTGSGKSVGINTFILSLLYQMTPEQCRLIMIDPKMLE
ncbi:MAG: DNA translocase FtsK 4TM domain-containing protein, partial [Devosia sp.]